MSDVYHQFDLPPDPWATLDIGTADAARIAGAVRGCAENHGILSIAGPRGAGKTRALWSALANIDAHIIEPLRLDRERLHLGDILTACVRDLSTETPRRAGEARSAQVRRLLRTSKQRVVLVIDDAHVLHHATLRGLKRLRELGQRGNRQRPALAVILAGQADATEAAPEVALRSGHISCAGLTRAEAEAVLTAAFGSVFEGNARVAMAGEPAARNWLDLRRLIDTCLAAALARGQQTVTGQVVGAVLEPHPARPARQAGTNRQRNIDDVLRRATAA